MTEVKYFVTSGPAAENCYFIYNEDNLLIVDPGNDFDKIKTFITETNRKPVAILLTHTHYDHIGAVEEVRHYYDIPVYVSPYEQAWLSSPEDNLSGLMRHSDMADIVCEPADFEFEATSYTLGGMTFEVRETPGHSRGGVSFVFHDDQFVITGDALFAGSIGRSDLPTGNMEQLLTSVQTQLFSLPPEFIAYPGHNGPTTIGHEIATNPFFN
ncbi:MBL fold metallo-hydrolase [Vagococcus coleopterorum]|uniref:MBL fold metallo-hydrolase n=1 Tax=Vagococcus coleopterorum TaxID=2714946 RepID=A0A6G8AMK6_9ENTE|nr:MBL fold metallo-hydrolase [Vagococcus coleopterorum]QIL46314.1 MBL fold metallo-hydrolase [Vagococcus coleopterorum]